MIVVTGATGHLGTVLVGQLLERGEEVKYVTRSGPARGLEHTSAQPVAADLLDTESLQRAFDGAEIVYHSAARISILLGDAAELDRVNVQGTRSVLNAARGAGVRRVVQVGSIEAFPLERGPYPITEDAGFDPNETVMEYGRSKALAMQAAIGAASDGLECVVACPTAFIGPPDFRRSALGQVVYDVLHGRLPASVTGGFDFVDVRDVAHGLILTAESGRNGRVYLLSGGYATVLELVSMIATAGGVREPAFTLPTRVVLPFMPLVEMYYRASGRSPRFTSSSLKLLSLGVTVDSARARDELGYNARPLEETVADTVAWFMDEARWPTASRPNTLL